MRPEAEIELASMKLASLCDISVADTFIKKINNDNILFVKRFDRNDEGKRLGFMSGHSVLGMGIKGSERDEDLNDYRILTDRMKKFCATQNVKDDLLELFKRISYNIVVRNIDDHARNHGFLLENNQIRLSPAYDIVPSGCTPDMSSPAFCSMIIGLQRKVASKENLLTSVGNFDLTIDEGEYIFGKIAKIVGLSWRNVFSENNVSPEKLDKSLPVFEYWEQLQKEEIKVKNITNRKKSKDTPK